MEDFKSALKAQCNDNFAQCNVISCETRVWKTSFPNKPHMCHGNTYDELKAYYAPKHADQIAEMTVVVATVMVTVVAVTIFVRYPTM